MKTTSYPVGRQGLLSGVLLALALTCTHAAAQSSNDNRIADDGTVRLDGVSVPLPPTLSPEAKSYLRYLILDKPFGTPVSDIAKERARQDQIMLGFLEPMRKRYQVDIAEQKIAGIVTDVVTPVGGVSPENRNRILINLHGGGFTTGARSASLVESVPLAALMRIKVISIDYRMSPEYQFPAASEDVTAVYRELLKTYDPNHIGIYGCSAGGLLTAESIAWFQAHDLPNPAAIGVFCASLGPFGGGDAAALAGPLLGNLPKPDAKPGKPYSGPIRFGYLETAKDDDPLAYPLKSPELLGRFPPTLFISETRGFEFANALNSHNKLAEAGVESEFHAWDGLFHGFFYNSELPESREAYGIMVKFFERHLAK